MKRGLRVERLAWCAHDAVTMAGASVGKHPFFWSARWREPGMRITWSGRDPLLLLTAVRTVRVAGNTVGARFGFSAKHAC
jgi:hypothetical protein